jgi:hypothetical protein
VQNVQNFDDTAPRARGAKLVQLHHPRQRLSLEASLRKTEAEGQPTDDFATPAEATNPGCAAAFTGSREALQWFKKMHLEQDDHLGLGKMRKKQSSRAKWKVRVDFISTSHSSENPFLLLRFE